MDQAKLIKAKEYYELTKAGKTKEEASLELFGKKSPAKVEESQEYLAVLSAASALEKAELKKEVEQIKRKQIKAYSNLIDKGEELMNEAKTLEDKMLAQNNQRKNLQTGIVENAIAWDGENRNQNDLGDILEGVIV